MILVDFNQMALANLFVSLGNHTNADLSEGLLRHMIINSLRVIAKTHKSKYGELVICADGRKSWRRDVFPYYKAARRKSRKESEIDWDFVHATLNKVREEISEYMPYKVLHFEELEADDIIGILAKEYGDTFGGEKVLIMSADKDFIQLQKYLNVSQRDSIRDKWIRHSDPVAYLHEHILIGDRSDGIPNIMSNDGDLVNGVRQKPMTKKRKEMWDSFENIEDQRLRENYLRNKKLIDLDEIPDKCRKMVLDEYTKPKTIGKRRMNTYFIKYQLTNLLADKGDF